MKIATALRSSMAQEIVAALVAGTTSAPKIEIYTGSVPSQMGQAITDTLLAELEMSVPAATETGGVITLEPITNDSSANDTGTAGWARMIDRDGTEVIYLTVSATGGSGELKLNSTSISSGAPVAISSGTITVGGA